MSSHAYSKFTTSRELTYSYIHISPTQGRKEYILFLHGFPSGSHDWKFQVEYFAKKGYGIVVPDLLGYGSSSKPVDVKFYSGKGMAGDIREILEHEKVEKVVGVAHDWGSFLLSRMVNYYPEMFSKLVFIDIGYTAPGSLLTEKTVRGINTMVQEHMGFMCFGYWLFFQEEGAVELMNKNGKSLQSLMHTRDEEVGKKYMGAEGGTRIWLEEGRVAVVPTYYTSEDQEYNTAFFAPENGGYGAAINWYIAQLEDINAKDDKAIPEQNGILYQPTLLLAGKHWITATADFPAQMEKSTKDLSVEVVDAGHWIMLERPEETNVLMDEFIGNQ